jgi:hypothetical protein
VGAPRLHNRRRERLRLCGQKKRRPTHIFGHRHMICVRNTYHVSATHVFNVCNSLDSFWVSCRKILSGKCLRICML